MISDIYDVQTAANIKLIVHIRTEPFWEPLQFIQTCNLRPLSDDGQTKYVWLREQQQR